MEDPSTQEELHCTQSPILKNVTLRGGIKAGNFSDLGDEKNMHMCIALCCERKTCDLAFMIGGTCIAVDCFSEELCQAVKARPTKYDPQIAFIRRRELQRPARKGKSIFRHLAVFKKLSDIGIKRRKLDSSVSKKYLGVRSQVKGYQTFTTLVD